MALPRSPPASGTSPSPRADPAEQSSRGRPHSGRPFRVRTTEVVRCVGRGDAGPQGLKATSLPFGVAGAPGRFGLGPSAGLGEPRYQRSSSVGRRCAVLRDPGSRRSQARHRAWFRTAPGRAPHPASPTGLTRRTARPGTPRVHWRTPTATEADPAITHLQVSLRETCCTYRPRSQRPARTNEHIATVTAAQAAATRSAATPVIENVAMSSKPDEVPSAGRPPLSQQAPAQHPGASRSASR